MLVLPGLAFSRVSFAQTSKQATTTAPAPPAQIPNEPGSVGEIYHPTYRPVMTFAPVNVREAARQEALEPSSINDSGELRAIDAPKGEPPAHPGIPILSSAIDRPEELGPAALAPLPSTTGPSPGPTKTFKAEFLSSTNIPPDTMGAVGTTHILTVSNNQIRITDRNGTQLQRMTLNAFWAGVTLEGGATPSTFDPKVLYDRFNNRFMFVSSANAQSLSSATLIAVSQTADPTGLWNRYAVDADPAATAAGGLYIDYPSLGFNKNWIVVNYNTFGYGTSAGLGYARSDIFVLDKQAAYANTLSTITLFSALTTTCTSPFEGKLGCGFTMVPAITEDNTTDVEYLVENWASTNGQLRLSKITGTASAPVLTVGTQFPQSPFSWRFNAARVNGAGGSGGYIPQRNLFTYAPSGIRIMGNDSRIQNSVFRNGSLWTTHHVMIAATPTAAGLGYSTLNPDNHTAVQWWEINPAVEAGLDPITGVGTTPLQRARIEDATADNCNSGNSNSSSLERTGCTSANQVGTFFAYPSISVNQNNDVLIGFTQFSAFTYPSGAYAIRLSGDTANTTRDPVVYRPGQTRYDLQAGATAAAAQTRWGDYSAAQTDPLDDTKFWTVQEYAGTYRNDFTGGTLRPPWETWWAQVNPAGSIPSRTGNLIISEFRLRGPQGANDEYIELYNPSDTPVIVNTADNSDGWAVGFDDGVTTQPAIAVIPNGTVVPARGHLLVTNNPDNTDLPTITYGLNTYPTVPTVRGADSDTGYSINIADTNGVAIFRTSTRANFSLATRMDAVGPETLPVGSFYKEGTGLPASITTALQHAWSRDLCAFFPGVGCTTGGLPKDTDNNAADFLFVDVAGTAVAGAVQKLGAPGPQNLDGPINRNSSFGAFLLDASMGATQAPNRVRKQCAVAEECDPTRSNLGTLSLRRRFTNNTGGDVTRLRFRIIDITTFPSTGLADIRALSSVAVPGVTVNDATTCAASGTPGASCTVTVEGTTLETPPAQALGGGLFSSLSAGTVTFAAPLANGASINLQFLLGVQQLGTFRFLLNIEALP